MILFKYYNQLLCRFASWFYGNIYCGNNTAIICWPPRRVTGWPLCKLWEHCFLVPDLISLRPRPRPPPRPATRCLQIWSKKIKYRGEKLAKQNENYQKDRADVERQKSRAKTINSPILSKELQCSSIPCRQNSSLWKKVIALDRN